MTELTSILLPIMTTCPCSSETISLEGRMKSYEKVMDTRIPSDQAFLVRLDGNRFSKFTNKLQQPFDRNFTNAMMKTMGDLLETYHPSTAYSHSDEITLMFPVTLRKEVLPSNENPSKKNEGGKKDIDALLNQTPSNYYPHLFNGRIQKLTSELASYCSLRFTYHLKNTLLAEKDTFDYKDALDLLINPMLNFDARVIVFPKDKSHDMVNHQIWRSMRDCPRNCISKLAEPHVTAKQRHKKNSKELLQILLEKTGFEWSTYDTYLKYGVYCKMENKRLIKQEQKDIPLFEHPLDYNRSKLVFKTIEIHEFDIRLLALFQAKKWNDANIDTLTDTKEWTMTLVDLDSVKNKNSSLPCNISDI
ncbi:MAG: tRNAHis guanylyltransferase [Sylvanvirus sp.]|uniref:tRNAHis guanylyltransferase n=1 Tax=Sylvanvirus sp. TaxID=2487774 RepID=A0A3G5AID0_9VIRU|nr:MAG: tRNAHis guanylyltransferase [Sylvanvirus sp.]